MSGLCLQTHHPGPRRSSRDYRRVVCIPFQRVTETVTGDGSETGVEGSTRESEYRKKRRVCMGLPRVLDPERPHRGTDRGRDRPEGSGEGSRGWSRGRDGPSVGDGRSYRQLNTRHSIHVPPPPVRGSTWFRPTCVTRGLCLCGRRRRLPSYPQSSRTDPRLGPTGSLRPTLGKGWW